MTQAPGRHHAASLPCLHAVATARRQRSCEVRVLPPVPCARHPYSTGMPRPARADRRSRELAARLDVVGKVEKEVAKASGLMEGVEAEIGRKKEVSRKVGACCQQ